ncbi:MULTISPECIES: sodium:proton exchanger [Mycobacterium]|uniref:Sodium/calcium exchanger family protein n=1 Tax=Mycobacterium kiyosense TaxID=2871094 RepID=A0A9P3Q944_9MYCO|nr:MULTISPECIES: sodium:proton exchanger [Mycobacterium]BDB42178.1 sodium/calcium exchanger family protein [Mycobacterium kiyosense]BDE14542.1 sodium/calcium exchanger family protein [Mycobacterium sp. 20KCMC460]GLB92597.1 sodium/calcium exchanger family protein [Mycobacterium kiyosense]GLC10821.1 sodium/calcium exchanger family protein [Mycobacterium kiyosense]GLC16744.1 sodium/calcium exchanger family protein [Mycobacterium kiyosense]
MANPDQPDSGDAVSGRTAIGRVMAALLVAAPAVVLRVTGTALPAPIAVVVFGAAVLASVALLMWAAEAARADISGSLALALLALVAILPEYAVDIFFAYSAGHRPEFAAYATANMTGANRLLIGVAWPLLVFTAIWAVRRRPAQDPGDTTGQPTGWLSGGVVVAGHRRVELLFLGAATLYALIIPLTGRLAWYDAAVLGGLFAGYLWRIRGSAESEEELTGVAATVAAQPRVRRRVLVVLLFAAAAVVILSAAEPFGEALVEAGSELGIDRFLLVQWLAPIASESPEVLVAITFALRGRADDGMGALLAAKLNQWTLLVACLPIAYYLGGGHAAGLPLDARQTEEFVLTTAQTVLGIAVLINLRLTGAKALLLLGLFLAQFVLPDEQARYIISVIYAGVAVVFFLAQRRDVRPLVTSALRNPQRDASEPRSP